VVRFTRVFEPGGAYFFTLVTCRRRPIFSQPLARALLGNAFREVRSARPFQVDAMVLLPDHLHCIWFLPSGDSDFPTRWRKIKELFTKAYVAAGGPEAEILSGEARKGLRGVWQPRYWEHALRDDTDRINHADYIHYNPVKHGHVLCPHAWDWSTFHRWVAAGLYELDWCCGCSRGEPKIPDFGAIEKTIRE
jgi:putative transposase